MLRNIAPRLPWLVHSLPYLAFAAVIATALVSSAGIASSPLAQRDSASAPPIGGYAVSDGADPRVRPVAARSRTRPAGSGVIEAIEPLGRGADQAAEFNFTVRMRDGSRRVSRGTGRARWQVGDRIIVLGGTGAAPQ